MAVTDRLVKSSRQLDLNRSIELVTILRSPSTVKSITAVFSRSISSVDGKIVTEEIDGFETTDLVGSQLCV